MIEVELLSPLIVLSRTAVNQKNVIRSVNGERVHRLVAGGVATIASKV